MDEVLGDLAIADQTADADMADITPRAVQKQEKKSKDKKKEKSKDKEHKKDKKRRHSEVNGTAEDGEKKKKKKSKRESSSE